MVTKSRHVNLLQAAEEARRKRSKLLDELTIAINADEVRFESVERLLKNIKLLSDSACLLTKEGEQPYTS